MVVIFPDELIKLTLISYDWTRNNIRRKNSNFRKNVENWFSKYQGLKLQLKQANFEKGILQSEIDELKADFRKCQSSVEKLKNMIPGHNLESKEARVLFKKEKLFQDQKNEINALIATIKILEMDKAALIYKINNPPIKQS